MSIDPYSLCPCGSDKKVKFCCHDIVAEMQRIMSLRQNNQLHMALQALGKLRKSLKSGHTGEIWVRVTELTILFEDNQPDTAKVAAEDALKAFPDDPQIVALSAITMLLSDGVEDSKDLVDRAFQVSTEKYSNYVSNLAALLSQSFIQSHKMMAGREHLILALRLAADPTPIIEQLTAFDTSLALPYWLRTDYPLRAAEVSDDLQAAHERTLELAQYGCFGLAAVGFEKLANKQPDNPNLWYNTGLCLAWSGDERGAIEAFGEATLAEKDFDRAVECETLCQLLELLDPEEGVQVSRTKFTVTSTSKLLTVLEGHARIVSDGQEQSEQAGTYSILDRPAPQTDEIPDLTIKSIPTIIAYLSVFDANPDIEQEAVAFLQCVGREDSSEIVSLVMEAAQGEIAQEGETEALATISNEINEIQRNWYFPDGISLSVAHRLEREYWDHCVNEKWPNLPLTALDGKTPLEAIDDEEFKTELAAALNTFEAICDQQGTLIDLEPLRARFKTSAPTPLTVDDEAGLFDMPLPQLQRLSLADLSDAQILHVMKRASITQASALSYSVYKEVLGRTELIGDEDSSAIYGGMVSLCRKKFCRDEALSWIEKGRAYGQSQSQPLENLVTWDLREATVRMWEPDDPQGPELLKRLWEETSVKLPFLREVLTRLVESSGIDPPWNDSGIQIAGGATPTSGEVWTPDAQPTGEQSKLWVPGQD